MDNKSKKVLQLLRNEKAYDELFYGAPGDVAVLAEKLSISFDECRAAIDYLEKCGFVEFYRDNKERVMTFKLTHTGMNCKTFKRIETLDFLKKSVVIPIVVAFITAILTTGTLWLLGWK